jgi:hypothetical protein
VSLSGRREERERGRGGGGGSEKGVMNVGLVVLDLVKFIVTFMLNMFMFIEGKVGHEGVPTTAVT